MLTLRQWLSSGPFTLTMSSGFFGFYAHAGVLRVLEEEELLPARASGSSAGALATGFWAAGASASELVAELQRLARSDFWDPAPGFGLLRGQRFGDLLGRLLPVRTFAECRIPVCISVFDLTERRTKTIDSGELAPAIQASCTVPLLFHPFAHHGHALFDGGIFDRPGLAGVPHDARVFYHHLSSRVPFPSLHDRLGRGIPRRAGLVPFVIDALPRPDPFRLDEGRRAIDVAAGALRAALDEPLAD
jgi:NTE family protein